MQSISRVFGSKKLSSHLICEQILRLIFLLQNRTERVAQMDPCIREGYLTQFLYCTYLRHQTTTRRGSPRRGASSDPAQTVPPMKYVPAWPDHPPGSPLRVFGAVYPVSVSSTVVTDKRGNEIRNLVIDNEPLWFFTITLILTYNQEHRTHCCSQFPESWPRHWCRIPL